MEPKPDKGRALPLGTGKILFMDGMDDEAVIRQFADKALASLGYRIESVAGGQEVIERWRRATGGEPL